MIDRLANNLKGIFSWTQVNKPCLQKRDSGNPIPLLPVLDDDQRILVGEYDPPDARINQ
jgi:hypothetical protein